VGRRGMAIGLALAILLFGLTAVIMGKAAGGAAEEEVIGRYQAAAPDLVLDTATGRLVSAKGGALEAPVDPTGKEVGRYSVAGYVTAVTRSVGLDVISRPVASVDLVKGYVVLDTKTGRVLRQRVYYSQPIQQGDL